jgi:hypothetical protein
MVTPRMYLYSSISEIHREQVETARGKRQILHGLGTAIAG